MASYWDKQKTRIKKSFYIFVVLDLGMLFWGRCSQKFWTQMLACIILFFLTCFSLMFFHEETPACENEYKERRQFVSHGDFCSITSCQVKISTIFKYMEFLAAFQEPPNVIFGTIGFCRILVQKHCFRMWVTKINQSWSCVCEEYATSTVIVFLYCLLGGICCWKRIRGNKYHTDIMHVLLCF